MSTESIALTEQEKKSLAQAIPLGYAKGERYSPASMKAYGLEE